MTDSVLKRKKGSWDPETMKAALDAVRTGRKIKEVARSFMLPESSIRDRLKKGKYYDPSLGRKATFSKEEEKELTEHIVTLAKTFYGITQVQLRKLAYDYAVAKNIKNIFSEEKGMAGKCWLYSFLKRNPGISLRAPEPTSINRVLGFNKTEINIFFNNLEKIVEKHRFPANRIFNVDETGITTVHNPGKIYAPKGLKQVGKITSAERGQNVTVVCAFSSTGIYIPPMFIYPRQRMKASLQIEGPVGAKYECSKSGWINEDIFLNWLRHFNHHVDAQASNPTLLILDNHSSHSSLQAYEFCRNNSIHVLSLPPHTSHKMQPLDVTFYGPLKSAFHRECDLYMKNHPFEKITHDVLASIFNRAYIRVATMDKAVKGFEVTGIYPLNPHIFDTEEIITSDPISEDPVSVRCDEQPIVTHSHQSVAAMNPASNDLSSNTDQPIPSTSQSILQELSPVPQKRIVKGKRQTKKQHSSVLTSTPLKEQLQEKERKRLLKERQVQEKSSKGKGKAVKGKNLAKGQSYKRKVNFSSSEENSDENVPLVDLCNSKDDNTNTAEDICTVCGEFGRDKEIWFRCCSCSNWVHKECSGKDNADHFICDFC